MPGGDRTGPVGYGPMTGRGFGFCAGGRPRGYGYGSGFGMGRGFANRRFYGRGYGRGFLGYTANPTSPEDEKEFLQEQKNILQGQLEAIEKQLENM